MFLAFFSFSSISFKLLLKNFDFLKSGRLLIHFSSKLITETAPCEKTPDLHLSYSKTEGKAGMVEKKDSASKNTLYFKWKYKV